MDFENARTVADYRWEVERRNGYAHVYEKGIVQAGRISASFLDLWEKKWKGDA